MERGHLRQESPAEASGNAIAQLLRRPTSEGQHEDGLRILPLGKAGDDGFHDGGGLARTRTSQDQQRPLTVLDYRGLLLVELGGGHSRERHEVQPRAHSPWIPPRCDTIDR